MTTSSGSSETDPGGHERRLPGGREREYDFGLAPGEPFEPSDVDDEPFDLALPHVMTALGPISPDDLGACLVHERLLTNPSPAAEFDPDLQLDDRDAALAELEDLFNAGGRAILDVSTDDAGRRLDDLLWVAARAPVHLVLATGHARELYALPSVSGASVDDLAAGMIRDLTDGIAGTTAKAGAIVVGASLQAITPNETRVLRAAARASLTTGAPIVADTERGTMALDLVSILREAGVEPNRIVVSHLDRRLDDFAYLHSILTVGVFVAFNNIGHAPSSAAANRATGIKRLADEGFGDQLVLAGDMPRRSSLLAYGGQPGLGYVVERVPLLLMEAGLDASTVRRLLVENPARTLAIRRG